MFCMWCEDRDDRCKDKAGVKEEPWEMEGRETEPGGRASGWWQPESSQVSAEHRGASWDPRSRSLEGASGSGQP